MASELETMIAICALLAWATWVYCRRAGNIGHDLRALQDALADRPVLRR